MKRTGRVFALLMLALLLACRSENAPSKPAVEMRQATDDLGRTLTVPAKITRVVSLAPSATENIFAVGAGERLVGVTTFCNYPEEAKLITKVGDTINPNMESIIALKPDVVFVSSASQLEAFTKTLETNGIAVYITDPKDIEGIFFDLKNLGDLFGTQEQTAVLVKDLELRLLKLTIAGPGLPKNPDPVRVFVQISREPLFTVGRGSFINTVVGLAGGKSVTEKIESAYPKISKEAALALQPDVIILSDSEDNKEPNDVFKRSPAVKNGRVYLVSADLLSRPGPRVFDAIEQVYKAIHSGMGDK